MNYSNPKQFINNSQRRMSKRVSSVLNLIDLKRASSIAVKYPLKGIEVVGEASGILETSKGRDMICSLI